ncbi:uncharacterized protein LOC116211575 [Punica granatum]|uniref:Uncharacterized protein n=2 Tax=Punica granatum TaxID=22663 RepID=A0A2I0KEI8_PUNGR|nr:uncharacterized protein LOC116211575 [Punica granatum]PKI66918.1 hypothetical protein CRG98_012681 [Punica granatum]
MGLLYHNHHHRLASVMCFLIAAIPLVQSEDSIYDHLRQFGLPAGLLPKGITDFTIDPSDGRFQVNLPQPCNAKFENQVHYDFNVTGTLSPGQIGELSGVSAQELFLWFPVKGIHVDVPSSGLIYFDVGVVDKQFSLSLFESPPDCAAVDPNDPEFSCRPEKEGGLQLESQTESGKICCNGGQENGLRAAS